MKKNLAFLLLSLVSMVLAMRVASTFQREETSEAPRPAVDYASSENWAYRGEGEGKNADVFLLCPTVDLGENGRRNMSLSDSGMRRRFLGALNMERGIYENSCRLYAPFYRQATLPVYELSASQAEPYFSLAYADVREAFLHYLKTMNRGRPIVLAGFSQGSDMCLRLMRELFADPEIAGRLVATYAVGWRLTEQDVRQWPQLKPANDETDTGVIVSFNCESPEVAWSPLVPEKTFGINPLNWRTDDTPADRSLHRGACFTDYSGAIVREIPEFTGCHRDPQRGVFKLADIPPENYPPVLPLFGDGVFHLYDYQFFYRNLQENVARRVDSFLQSNREVVEKKHIPPTRRATKQFKENYPAIYGREPPATLLTAIYLD